MKIRLLSALLTCALAFGVSLRAENAPKASAGDHEEHTELGDHMEKISAAFRKIRRPAQGSQTPPIAEAANAQESLKQLAIIREHANASLKLEPAKKADVPAEQQAKFVAAYRDGMKAFLEMVDKAEAAIKAGNFAEAGTIVVEMNDAQKKGHKEFKKENKKK